LIYSSTRGDFTQIQILKEEGFSCAAVSTTDYLVYGFPEYCKVAIYLWQPDGYRRIAKLELGYHMGSKKSMPVTLIKFCPEVADTFMCINSKMLRKACVKDVSTDGNYGLSRAYLKFENAFRSAGPSIIDFSYSEDGHSLVVLTDFEIILLDPFLHTELHRVQKVPCQQPRLLLPRSFDSKYFPIVIFETQDGLVINDILSG
jgi:hypothetical protein